MNKRVFTTMLILTISFLIGLYVLKIFFPQEFVMVIENDKLILIGNYIDAHKWLYYICCGITAFITYWLFLCACKGKLYLNIKEVCIVLCFMVIVRLVRFLDPNIANHINICSFFIIPAICNFSLVRATGIYSFHGLCQILSLSIRNLPIYLTNTNILTGLLMTIECYFWLLLFYIIFNFNFKEKNL